MSKLIGKYEMYNFDEKSMDDYLKKVGAGYVLRQVLISSTPVIELKHLPDVNEWSMKTVCPVKTHTLRFKYGEATESETFDARECRVTVNELEDGKMCFHQQCSEGPDVVVILEENFEEGEGRLKMTMTADGSITTHMLYQKVTNAN